MILVILVYSVNTESTDTFGDNFLDIYIYLQHLHRITQQNLECGHNQHNAAVRQLLACCLHLSVHRFAECAALLLADVRRALRCVLPPLSAETEIKPKHDTTSEWSCFV